MSQTTMPDRSVYASAGRMAKPVFGNTFFNNKMYSARLVNLLYLGGKLEQT
jgi:hypothetical protein